MYTLFATCTMLCTFKCFIATNWNVGFAFNGIKKGFITVAMYKHLSSLLVHLLVCLGKLQEKQVN